MSPPSLRLQDLRLPTGGRRGPYREVEVERARDLLERNRLGGDAAAVRDLLDADLSPVVAAAARVAGADGDRAALPRLRELAQSSDDSVAVAAAGALLALGERADAQAALQRLLALNPEGNPGAIQAAGELARLGDFDGLDVVERALASGNEVVRMIAAKQLLSFADGGDPHAVERMERTLADGDGGVRREAFTALSELGTPPALAALERYAGGGGDRDLRRRAAERVRG